MRHSYSLVIGNETEKIKDKSHRIKGMLFLSVFKPLNLCVPIAIGTGLCVNRCKFYIR